MNIAYSRGDQQVAGGGPEPADRMPPLSGYIGIEYQPESDFGFEMWAAMAGAQDRLSDRDIGDSRIDPAGTPGWASVGGRATWEPSELWTLSATLSNVLDAQYRVHGSGIDATGRNLTVSIRRQW